MADFEITDTLCSQSVTKAFQSLVKIKSYILISVVRFYVKFPGIFITFFDRLQHFNENPLYNY